MIDLVIVGAGGHGREAYGAVESVNATRPTWNVLGFVDDAPSHIDRVERLGVHVLGDLGWLADHPSAYVLAIGDPTVRARVAHRLEAAGCTPTVVVHPGATIGLDVRLDDGVLIYDRCTVTTNVTIGRHTHLNVGCAVQHDSTLGEFCQLSPGTFVNGDCTLGDTVFCGTGAIVTRGTSIGDRARIGAGAVVLDGVGPDLTVHGAPARPR
jgi:sugar O-acyltransferase (sialic acid O-acetyltransferase NeuD family)